MSSPGEEVSKRTQNDAVTTYRISSAVEQPPDTSNGPEQQLPPNQQSQQPSFRALSPDASDRIFPIRSIVNVEPPSQPPSPGARSTASYQSHHGSVASRQNSLCGTPIMEESYFGMFRSGSSNASGPRRGSVATTFSPPPSTIWSVGESTEADKESNPDPMDQQVLAFLTARHRHVSTDDGHMIVTGISGAERMQRCEDEPIHIPGAIQGFGCLVVLKEIQEDGILDIRVVSENSREIIGYSPSELFAIGNFLEILSDEQAGDFMDHLEFVREALDPRIDGPEVFSLIVTGRDSTQIKLWCAVHIPEDNNDIFICEFELENDHKYPLTPTDDDLPSTPMDTLAMDPSHEEFLESTIKQLASANDLTNFLKILVGLTKELTGFHRVMIYQFDEAWNGKVVSELVDPYQTKDLYKGLHFPASDIPVQARALYKINKVRLLYDRDQETARLHSEYSTRSYSFCANHGDDSLRAMSPIHLKYLGNMGVRASMSISITAFDQLWGLISCHSYGKKGMRVSFPIRKMCRLIGENASRNIERLSYARRLTARKLINTVPTEQNPGGYIVASSDDLLKLFDADCGLLSIRDETKVLGKLENSQEALALLEYLRIKSFTSVLTSQDLVKEFPDLKYKPGFQVVAGLLLVPLSSEGADFIVFFRKPQIKHVHWAGNPYDKKMKEGTAAFLEPRSSFKIWSETVMGTSREWTEEQVETAAVLCLVYGKFIEVWRQKEAALRNSQLTRLLLANASHEVRTPLNAIINYLEIALESPLDAETRDNLARSHSASKSLIYVINDLLDLTRTEAGQDLIKDEVFDLRSVIMEATDIFKGDATRKGLSFEVIEYPGLPPFVKGDPARLRQVVSNVTANAVKHTSKGGLKIEVWTGGTQDNTCDIEIAIEDTGEGISPSKLDTLFGELEQVHTEDDIDITGAAQESASFNALSKIPGQKMLGLGLAVVARSIRNMKGQLRLKSEEGKGSRFTLCLPFKLPEDSPTDFPEPKDTAESPVPSSPEHRRASPAPPKDDSEVTLIQHPPKARSLSVESINSPTNEIDRLVGAISSPRCGSTGTPTSAKEYFTSHSRPQSISFLPTALLERPQLPARSSSADGGDFGPLFGQAETSAPTSHLTPAPPPAQAPAPISSGTSSGPPAVPPKPPSLSSKSVSPKAPQPVKRQSSPFKQQLQREVQFPKIPGQEIVPSSAVPLRPVKIDFANTPVPSGAVVPLPPQSKPQQPEHQQEKEGADSFVILVAEDDPINSKIIKKRLEKMGHTVLLTKDGRECWEKFKESLEGDGVKYQAVLMDMQMPIMDGGTSATKIRAAEEKSSDPSQRIPIFAVSASLVEPRWKEYLDLGFDGWILKPIDFKRLQILLEGTQVDATRKAQKYVPGKWEQGGWFLG
ncbi:Similar to Cyanobacterial phytochrome B; acc. no. Q9R6X3 [Pyronema omphalodes CBS 100304]|uniref:Similar to Cyanobacterial phytochrome B acc. no. Q9R6X3 n=1 Tax=Pyronema omphalodes (strain CBS 100304) TaxID=1076935 RepID=U4KZK7_PYROM|nr:Similar to Cyanobacterial phytochrome B; acc. no. Q9R6X3 [Pyronema omphalodes CBS 100304]